MGATIFIGAGSPFGFDGGARACRTPHHLRPYARLLRVLKENPKPNGAGRILNFSFPFARGIVTRM
jgi:hypothetical protein